MLVLVKFNEKHNELVKILEKKKIQAISLFELDLDKKKDIQNNLNKIKELAKKHNCKYKAIQLRTINPNNQLAGTINNLRQDFDLVIGLGGLNKTNRFFLENTKIDILQDPQNSRFKPKIDFIHHFNSGINHILCKFAQEKKIIFFFSLNFSQGKTINSAKEIGRINQNIKFANKYKIPIYINYIIEKESQIKTLEETRAIYSLFDTDKSKIKDNINSLETKLKQREKQKSKNFIKEGIEILP